MPYLCSNNDGIADIPGIKNVKIYPPKPAIATTSSPHTNTTWLMPKYAAPTYTSQITGPYGSSSQVLILPNTNASNAINLLS